MKRLLVVHHSKSGSTAAMTDAVLAGANHPDIENVIVKDANALDATPEDVLAADGLVLGTPANFGYMSGALKHFFDSVYYEVIDSTAGRPVGVYVKGSTDTSGAVRAIEAILTGLDWRLVAPPLAVEGELDEAALAAAYELGATVAATLSLGTP